MDDLISRQAAIDACMRVRELRAYDEIEEIEALPSAHPKHGRWEPEYRRDIGGTMSCRYACSLCGKFSLDEFLYCPNCGAKMDEVEEDEVD